MMRYNILLGLIALTGFATQAGINSGEPAGYLARGDAFYNIGYHEAALDQLSFFDEIASPTEISRVKEALAAAKAASPEALGLLLKTLHDYPATSARAYILLVIGNIYVDGEEYDKAYEAYSAIGDRAFGPELDSQWRLRKAFAAIQTDRIHEAELLLSGLEHDSRYGADAAYYQGYIAYTKGDYSKAKKLLEQVDVTGVRSLSIPLYLTQINYMEGNDNAALQQARRGLSIFKQHHPFYWKYGYEMGRIAGEIKYKQGNTTEAVPLLKDYIDFRFNTHHPVITTNRPEEAAGAYYILGIEELKSGNHDNARMFIQHATERQNAVGQAALLTLGQIYYNEGDTDNAIDRLSKAVKMDADRNVTEAALYDLIVATSSSRQGETKNLINSCENFLQRFPNSRFAPETAGYLAQHYIAGDNYEGALVALEKINNSSDEIQRVKLNVVYGLAIKNLKEGRTAMAMDYASQALKLERLDPDIALECTLIEGDCLYRQGKYKEAEKRYESYLKRAKKGVSQNIALTNYNLAYALFSQEKYAKAASEFEKYLKAPGETSKLMQADGANRLADCLYYQGKLEAANKWYEKAAKLNPGEADYALYQQALVYGYQGKNSDKINALKKLQREYKNSPYLPDALLELAATQRQTGLDGEAIVTYQTIERNYPTASQGRRALFMMSSLQAARGDTDAAFASYKRLISGHPNSAEAKSAIESFKELAVQEGRVDEYASFVATTSSAPKLTDNEIEDLTYRSAKTARQLEQYLAKYPDGSHADEALITLIRNARKQNDTDEVISLATRMVTDYSDSKYTGEAWLAKGEAELSKGMNEDAYESYARLEGQAPDTETMTIARRGRLEAALALERHDAVVEVADLILNAPAGSIADSNKIKSAKAKSLKALNRGEEAATIWKELSADPSEKTGAESAFLLAEYYFTSGQTDKAWDAVNALVESNTPQSYWLARGYILTSDLYRAQGDDFEADEYLKVLKENYPGTEQEIFDMIEERMSK